MASNTTTEDIQLRIRIAGSDARKEMEKLRENAAKIKDEMKGMKKGSDEFNASAQKLSETNKKLDELKGKISLTQMTMKELRSEIKMLSMIKENMDPATKAFQETNKRIQECQSRLQELRTGLSPVGQAWANVKKELMGFNGLIMAVFSGGFMVNALKDSVVGLGKVDDKMADVMKTTEMTKEEVRELRSQFNEMGSRTSTDDMLGMAAVAGQAGIAKDSVDEFVKSVDVLNVALGDEMGGAEEVADKMSKLRNIFTDIKTQKVDQDMMHIGNALNVLSAEGAATANGVQGLANRIGGVGITLGLTTPQILGMSAALEEMNVTEERGGTAVVKILQKMTTETQKFAQVAGYEGKAGLEEFTNLVNNDLYAAFVKVIEGSKQSGAQATEFSALLGELEVQGVGASEVIAKLGNNTELLEARVSSASKAIKETSSVTAEFNVKNNTLGAEIDKLNKKISSLMALPFFEEFAMKMVRGISRMIDNFKALPRVMEEYSGTLIALTTVMAVYYARTMAAAGAAAYQRTVELAGVAALKLKEFWTKASTAATVLYQIAVGVLTGQITLATAATQAYAIASAATPWGLIAAAIGAIAYAWNEVRQAAAEATESEKNYREAKQATEKLQTQSMDLQERARLAKELSKEVLQASVNEAETVRNTWVDKEILIKTKFQDQLTLLKILKDKNADQYREQKAIIDEQMRYQYGATLDEIQNSKDVVNSYMAKFQAQLDIIKKEEDESAKALEKKKHMTEEEKKAREKAMKEAQKLAEESKANTLKLLQELQDLEISHIRDAETREKAKLAAETERRKQKIAAEIADETVKAQLIEALNQDFVLKIEEIENKYRKEKLKKEQEISDAIAKVQDEVWFKSLSKNDQELAQLQKWFEDKLFEYEKYGLDTTALVEQMNSAINALVQEQANEEIRINQEKNKKIEDQERQRRMETIGMVQSNINQMANIYDNFAQAQMNREQTELNEFTLKQRQKKRELEKQLRAGIITQDQYQDQLEKMQDAADKKRIEIQNEQAKRQKRAQIIEATAQMFIAIAKANAAGYPAALWLIPMAIAAGGSAIASLASNPVPQYGEGLTPEILGGDKHSAPSGGNPVLDPNTGKVLATFEQGESLVNADSTGVNIGLIKWMNQNPGKQITVDVIASGMAKPNFAKMVSSSTAPAMQSGFVSSTSQPSAASSILEHQLNVLIEQNSQMITILQNQPKTTKAVFSIIEMNEVIDEKARIDKLANL